MSCEIFCSENSLKEFTDYKARAHEMEKDTQNKEEERDRDRQTGHDSESERTYSAKGHLSGHYVPQLIK